MKANYEQQKYKESPLASLLTQIVTKISELKKSYSDAPVDILKQLDAMAAYLNVLHGGILPYIDNKTPGIWDLLGLYTEYGKLIKITESLNEVPTQILVTPKLILFKEIIFAAFSNYIEDFMENGTFNKELLSNKNIDSILKYEHDRIIFKADKFAETDNREILEAEFNTIKQTLLDLNLGNINFSGDIGQIISVVVVLTECFTKPELSAAFKISHPVILELFVFLANQLETIPKDLKNLVSFLKPETIPELISSLPGSSLSITHQGNYNYKVESNETRNYDLPSIYSALHRLPRQLIIPAVITYMNQDSDKLFKLTVLQRLLSLPELRNKVLDNMAQDWDLVTYKIKDKELIPPFLNRALPASNEIMRKISQDRANNEKKLELVKEHDECFLEMEDQLSGLEAIENIDRAIRDNAQLLKDNLDLQSYLETDSALKEPFILAWNEEYKIIENLPYGELINPLITGNKGTVKFINEELCKFKIQLPFMRLNAVHNWLEAVQDSHSKGLANYKIELSSILNAVPLQDNAEEISTKSKKSKKIAKKPIASDTLNTNPIEALEKDIECLNAKVLNLDTLKTQCTEWSKHFIPKLLDEVSGDKSLEEALIKLSKQLSHDTHLLIEDMHANMLTLNQTMEKAKKQLNAALFAEKMHSANPEQMKQTITDKEIEYNNLENKIKTLEDQLNKTNEAMTVTCSKMEELKTQCIEQKNGILQVVSDTENLISESNGISKKYQSTNQSKSIVIEKCWPNDFVKCTNEEIVFLEKLFLQYEAERLRPYKDKLELLNAIKQTFEASINDTTIPFKALDALIKTSTDKNRLFILLDFNKSLSYWNEYRSQQDDTFRFAPNKDERNTARQLLSKAIADTINETDIEMKNSNPDTKQREITSSLETLRENKGLFLQKNEEKIKLEEGVVSTNSSYDALTKTNQQHEKDKQTQSEAINGLRKEQQTLKHTISILGLMIAIFEGITEHGELITSFCNGDALFNLENSIQPIEQSRNALQEKMSLFCTVLDKLDSHEKSSYQLKLEQIQTLLANCDDRIKATMQSRYEMTCINPIAEYQDAYNTLCDNHTGLISNPQTTWEELFDPIATPYINLSKQMKQHEVNLSSADRILTVDMNRMMFTLSEAFYETERQNTQKSFADLNKELSRLGIYIEDHASIIQHTINVTLEGDKALIFNAINPNEAYPETDEKCLENTTNLQEVEKNLNEVYVDFAQLVKNPDNLETLKEKIQIYNDAKTQAFKKLNDSKETNAALEQRIKDRNDLVDEQKDELTGYLADRNQQIYFKDREKRNTFINDLKQKLDLYKADGNSAEVFDHIRMHRKQFTGGKLEQILNQLTAEVMDSDYKIPTSYVSSEQEKIRLDNQAAIILTHFGVESDYFKRIMGLHDQITAMMDFGNSLKVTDPCRQIAIDLANKLDEDIYRFVIKHPENAPDADSYGRFQDQFTARSHTKDEDMQPYLPRWAAILANIAIAVVSLGFALGVKAVVSYVKTGESFLFFTQSNMQEKVGEINKLAKEILLAPAVA